MGEPVWESSACQLLGPVCWPQPLPGMEGPVPASLGRCGAGELRTLPRLRIPMNSNPCCSWDELHNRGGQGGHLGVRTWRGVCGFPLHCSVRLSSDWFYLGNSTVSKSASPGAVRVKSTGFSWEQMFVTKNLGSSNATYCQTSGVC